MPWDSPPTEATQGSIWGTVPYKIIALGIVFVTALAVRLYPVIHSPEKFRYGFGPFGDSFVYHTIAYNLYRGNGFSATDDGSAVGLGEKLENVAYEPAITRGPVYPFFITMVYKLLGRSEDMESLENWHKNWDKVRMVQCVLDATLCLTVFFITRTIFQKAFWPAFISATLYCFSFYNIYYTRALLSESVSAFLITWFILLFVLGLKEKRKRWWALAGLLFGGVVLNRPEYILFLFAVPATILFAERRFFQAGIKKATVFLTAGILTIAPWTARNMLVFKEPIPVAISGLGASLYFGSFETSQNWKGWDKFPDEIFADKKEEERVKAVYKTFREQIETGGIGAKEADATFMELAFDRMRRDPMKCFITWLVGIPRLWYQDYIPMYRVREPSGNFFLFYFSFALYAFFLSKWPERVLIGPVCLLFIYLNLIFLPAHIEPRYGVVLMPGIISVSGMGIWKALMQLRNWTVGCDRCS